MSDYKSCLVLSTGSGPAECRIAAGLALKMLEKEAAAIDLQVSAEIEKEDRHGPFSGLIQVSGTGALDFAKRWHGTLKWQCKSPLRPNHRRQNWFLGFNLVDLPPEAPVLNLTDVEFETMRAGGPGGQHQNTTDSAVRARHRRTNLSVVVREGRSQHQNRALAIRRLEAKLWSTHAGTMAAITASRHRLHKALERGDARRTFVGPGFRLKT